MPISLTDVVVKEITVFISDGKTSLSVVYSFVDANGIEYVQKRDVIPDDQLTAAQKTGLASYFAFAHDKMKSNQNI